MVGGDFLAYISQAPAALGEPRAMHINLTTLFAFFGVGAASGLYWYYVGWRRGVSSGGVAIAHIISKMAPEMQTAFEAAAKAAMTSLREQGSSR